MNERRIIVVLRGAVVASAIAGGGSIAAGFLAHLTLRLIGFPSDHVAPNLVELGVVLVVWSGLLLAVSVMVIIALQLHDWVRDAYRAAVSWIR